jgi:hypothetical protein
MGQTNMPHPRLVCDEALFDFGTRSNSIDVDHDFTIRNMGDTPLVISQVRSGCGCTQAKLSQNTIEPGSNSVLSARLSLKGIIGAKRTSIYLHSNDPEKPIFQCQISGTAVGDLSVPSPKITAPAQDSGAHAITAYPPDITLASSGPETSNAVRYVILSGYHDRPFNVTNVVVIPPLFPARIHSMKPAWTRLKIGPITPNAVTSGAVIRIYTDTPGATPLDIPVKSTRQP